MKNDTPITNAIERAATDDTGSVTRMEPIWEGLEKLERENARLRDALERCAKMPTYGERFEIVEDALSALPNDEAHRARSI